MRSKSQNIIDVRSCWRTNSPDQKQGKMNDNIELTLKGTSWIYLGARSM